MAIIIERQVPERGEHGMAAAPAGQCCCCCCCCLHSAGGLIGAVTARSEKLPTELPVSAINGPTLEPKYSAHGLYWSMLALFCLAAVIVAGSIDDRSSEQTVNMIILALVLPGLQLAASFVAALVIAGSKRVGKQQRMRHLGSITWRAFIGAVIGVLVMLPLLGKC